MDNMCWANVMQVLMSATWLSWIWYTLWGALALLELSIILNSQCMINIYHNMTHTTKSGCPTLPLLWCQHLILWRVWSIKPDTRKSSALNLASSLTCKANNCKCPFDTCYIKAKLLLLSLVHKFVCSSGKNGTQVGINMQWFQLKNFKFIIWYYSELL